MKIEELEQVLVHPNITIAPVVEEEAKLNRDRTFTLNGRHYRVEWWCNVMYLFSDDLMVVFDKIEQSGSWPNHAKLNLQFRKDGATVAVIELEQYPEK